MTPPPLLPDEVHVWWASLALGDAVHAAAWRSLFADERLRAARYRVEPVRRRFVAGRGLLRLLLGGYLNVEPALVRFDYGEFGKPRLDDRHGSDITFNLSHSGDVAVYAVARGLPVGVDIEAIDRMDVAASSAIVERFFSAREQAAYRALPGSQKPLAFLRAWTRKEACLKASGSGLVEQLAMVEVTLPPAAPAVVSESGTERPGWWLHDLVHPAVAGSLAVNGGARRCVASVLPADGLLAQSAPLPEP
jgi:4'-phosphopantetheinyl transferase